MTILRKFLSKTKDSVFIVKKGLAVFLIGLVCSQTSLANEASPLIPIRFLLSFDDGPSSDFYHNSTEQVLKTLESNNVQPNIKALFFVQTRAYNSGGTVIGQNLMRREWNEGHLVEFHTSTPHHSNHRYLNDDELQLSLEHGIEDLKSITGSAPKLVRPPFWNYDERTFAAYQKNGMQVLITDLSADDGKIWGVNFSFHKHNNFYSQLAEIRTKWQTGNLPVIDGCIPIVVTFHDVNSYTSRHIEDYLHILLQVAQELEMPTAPIPFYNNRDDLERAALVSAMHDTSIKPRLPGLWNWLWQ